MTPIAIREAGGPDLTAILTLFEQTILSVNAKDYSPAQVKVWTGSVVQKDRWLRKIAEQYFILALLNNEPAGFASLTQTGYLDFLYVSKDHQRRGVATALYNELETYAKRLALTCLETDASITAKSFFEKQGFTVLRSQQVVIETVPLTNFKMKKQLA